MLRSFPTYCGWAAVSKTSLLADQPGFPPDRLSSDRVPGAAGDQAHFRRRCAKPLGDLGIGLGRRLVPFGCVINAKLPIEKVNNNLSSWRLTLV